MNLQQLDKEMLRIRKQNRLLYSQYKKLQKKRKKNKNRPQKPTIYDK